VPILISHASKELFQSKAGALEWRDNQLAVNECDIHEHILVKASFERERLGNTQRKTIAPFLDSSFHERTPASSIYKVDTRFSEIWQELHIGVTRGCTVGSVKGRPNARASAAAALDRDEMQSKTRCQNRHDLVREAVGCKRMLGANPF
jgi:hypothetical protein